jgi:hypothetical protein
MTLTEAGRIKACVALHPVTYEWLKANAMGQRALGELIDSLVQKERLLAPVEQRLARLEAMVMTPQSGHN